MVLRVAEGIVAVMPIFNRETPRLRWGRVSQDGHTYFLTPCVKNRRAVFADAATASVARDVLRQLNADGDAVIDAATIMPDHLHVLLTLGNRLRLGQVNAKFKSLIRRYAHADWDWLSDGFERQVRNDESAEAYAFYIFMNPYRANLISRDEHWPWWFCADESQFRFLFVLAEDPIVPAEWVERSVMIGRTVHGR
jgi:putative transposase